MFIDDQYSNSAYIHYIEQMCGLPYCYNKLLDLDVYKDGKLLKKDFIANVRYLDFDILTGSLAIKARLDDLGLVLSENLAGGSIHCVNIEDYYNVCIELIRENPFAFCLRFPKFIKGKIPFDGITRGRDNVKKGTGSLFRPVV